MSTSPNLCLTGIRFSASKPYLHFERPRKVKIMSIWFCVLCLSCCVSCCLVLIKLALEHRFYLASGFRVMLGLIAESCRAFHRVVRLSVPASLSFAACTSATSFQFSLRLLSLHIFPHFAALLAFQWQTAANPCYTCLGCLFCLES